jgi:mono/diheme cytochrome c family protein
MKHSSGAQIARSNRSFEVDGVPTDVSGAAVVGDHLMLADGGEGLFLDCTLPHGFEDSLCIDVGRGDGLRGLAVGPRGQIWTLAAFDRVLGLIDASLEAKGHLPIGPGRFDDQLALGRSLFHRTDDARISSSGLACATCHPDGRQDGLVWRLAGERRQTPILAGRLAGTAPYNWLGTTETLEENIRQTVTRLGGRGLAEEEVRALARYLREGLRTPERPPPPDPTLVENGRRVFHDARVGCASCHAADEAFAGGGAHDVGTTGATELAEMRAVDGSAQPRAFDTPSLLFAGISAPYFHDGSAPGLDAVVSSAEHRMGNVRDLSESERRALLAYLESL